MKNIFILVLITILIDRTDSMNVSYNLPKLSPCAAWTTRGITFANSSTIGTHPEGIFVDTSNNVYAAAHLNNAIYVWFNGSTATVKSITNNLNGPVSVFAAVNGDIYIDNGGSHYEVDRWTRNGTTGVSVMSVNGSCFGLFIDMNNTLYCSIENSHMVVKKSLNKNGTMSTVVAGNGTAGNAMYLLNQPRGIFVDADMNLFVADENNDRIQLFRYGQRNATTVVVNGTVGTITLNQPTDVVLDGDGYLFIVDSGNNRIIGSGPNGFRCVVGCFGAAGSAADRFNGSRSLSFDNHGNLFITDKYNNRIQKFILASNYCNSTQSTVALSTTSITTDSATSTVHFTSLSSSMTFTTRRSTLPINSTPNMGAAGMNGPGTWQMIWPTATKRVSMNSTPSENTTEIDLSEDSQVTETTPVDTLSTNPLVTNGISPSSFYPSTCSIPASIGSTCSVSDTLCDLLQPCQNAGVCVNTNSTRDGYVCQCPLGFLGDQCQWDTRLCQPNTCWNNGLCVNLSRNDFSCVCAAGWMGVHCEAMVDYCQNIACENNGVCRSLFRDYQCDCVSSSYTGRHCEHVANRLIIIQIVAKSFAYIVIIWIISVFVFVGTLDVLKYFFHIDPVEEYRTTSKCERTRLNSRKSRVAIRFIYVNHTRPTSPVEESTVQIL